MVRLEVVDPDPDKGVVAAFEMDPTPGSAVALNGFHGSQVYPLSEHDQNLQVKFIGVENFVDVPTAEPTDKADTSQPGDSELKTDEPEPTPTPAKATSTTSKSTSSS